MIILGLVQLQYWKVFFFMLKNKEKNIKLFLKKNLENEKIEKAKKSLQTGRELLSFFHLLIFFIISIFIAYISLQ